MLLSWPDLKTVISTRLHALLYGPPGTGKTFIATEPDDYSLTLTAETPAAELRGHYIPKGPEFIWHDGPCVRAWREGKRIVLNEIDNASGDALVFLYAMLDDPSVAKLTLPTGETIRPRAGFQAIATTNATDLESALPAALLDRFAIRVHVDTPHPAALAKLPEALANMVRETINEGPERKVSLRQANAFHTLDVLLQNKVLAAQSVFGNRAPDIYNSILLALSADKIDPSTSKPKGARS